MKYYKVLYKSVLGELLSVGAAFHHPDTLVVEYTPGEETVAPKGTKLLIFDRHVNAWKFARRCNLTRVNWAEIWEVEATAVENIVELVAVSPSGLRSPMYYEQLVQRFWSCPESIYDHTVNVPTGTLACESVILKRKVA